MPERWDGLEPEEEDVEECLEHDAEDTGTPDTGTPDSGSPDTEGPDDTQAGESGQADSPPPDDSSPEPGDTGRTDEPGCGCGARSWSLSPILFCLLTAVILRRHGAQ